MRRLEDMEKSLLLSNLLPSSKGFTLVEVMAAVTIVGMVVGMLMIRRQGIANDALKIKYKREASVLAMKNLAEIEYSFSIENNTGFDVAVDSEEFPGYEVSLSNQSSIPIEVQDPLKKDPQSIEIGTVELTVRSPDQKEYVFVLYGPLKKEKR